MFSQDMSPSEMGGYPSPGALQDIADHEAMNMPEPGHSPTVQHSTKMAGDVLPIPGEKSMGQGESYDAVHYALGSQKDPKVISIGPKNVRSWYERRR